MDRRDWYDVRDGRRLVRPYEHTFTSFAKRRWVGRRVLDVMADEFPAQCTPAYLSEAMAHGRLLLNGRPVQPEDALRDGDKLEHVVVREEPSVPAAPIQLLHCDEGLVVLDKPAGVPVHHAGRFRRNSLVEILQAERPDLRLGDGCGARGGIHVLHRLDRQTSGVLMLPRTPSRATALGALLEAGELRKQYLARVCGWLAPGSQADVREPVRVRSANGATTCDCHPEGKPAHTRLRALGYDAPSDTSLLLCEPRTGRTHQIRLHTLHLGHPIANDALYRRPAEVAAPAPAPAEPSAPGGDTAGRAAKRARGAAGACEGGAPAPPVPPAADDDGAEVLWLHAQSYACAAPPLPFRYEAPPPAWAAPFLPLPPHALAPLDSPPASPRAAPAAAAPAAAPAAAAPAAAPAAAAPAAAAPAAAVPAAATPAAAAPAAAAAAPPAVPLRSPEGQRLLAECDARDRAAYDALWPRFQQQRGRTLCGPATAAMLLRATRGARADGAAAWDEEDVLAAAPAALAAKVRRCGLTLAEMAHVLRAVGLEPTAHHAVEADDDALLAPLLAALRAPASWPLLNYHMSTAGQPPFGGHFSPLGAFHAGRRRLLVLDVWPDTQPCWLDAAAVCAAMRAADAESGLARGWLHVVRDREAPPPA